MNTCKIPRLPQHAAGALLLCAGLALAGCNDSGASRGPGGGTGTVPVTPEPPIPTEPVDGGGSVAGVGECSTAGFACSWADVPLTVIDRSQLLGEQMHADLRNGKSVADTVAWLESEEPDAVVEHDGKTIRFRLPQGRPVWVVRSEEAAAMAANAAAFAPRKMALQAPRTANLVVAPGVSNKRALVLAPFQFDEMGAGAADVAQLLRDTHGYSGNVVYLANETPEDQNAGVANFDQFGLYDVVYVATHGGTLCASQCRSYMAMQRAYDTPADLVNATNSGVELMIFNGDPLLVATKEFFRDAYPNGLNDRLFYFDGNLTADADIATSLHGSNSVYLGWSSIVFTDLSDDVAARMFEELQTGLSVQEVHAALDQSLGQSLQTELLTNDRDIRIRDLIIPLDSITGQVLRDNQPMQVDGFVGDGLLDNLKVSMTVDGIHPDKPLDAYVVGISEGDRLLGQFSLAQGERITDNRYRLEVSAPLGLDAQKGQVLDLAFSVTLPEGGQSVTKVKPLVSNPNELPDYYTMFTITSTYADSGYMIKRTTLLWEKDPNNDPAWGHAYYISRGGTMEYESYTDVAGCRWQTMQTVPIPAGESNTTMVITKGSPPKFRGFATTKGISHTAIGSCDSGPSDPLTTTLGGIYLNVIDDVPMERGEDDPVGGFSGATSSGATIPTIIEYQFIPGDGAVPN